MNGIPRLIRRFVGILFFSFLLLILINILLLAALASRQKANAGPWQTAGAAAEALTGSEEGFVMPEEMQRTLLDEDVWAVFIDNQSLKAVWQSENLPPSIPLAYDASDIAALTRGYVDGYPTFTAGSRRGLMVLGYPKTSYWKHMWPSWDYQLIARAPYIFLGFAAINLTIIFLIYIIANTRLLAAVRPITDSIQALPTGKPVHVREKGLLREMALHINRTSDILQSQKQLLLQKETARANWIAGVSHDIRTPLSMIMGYAAQLKNSPRLTAEERKMAAVIVNQSERMRSLISDLNLASRLEYNMQPLHARTENAVAIVRQVAVDFINNDIEGKYSIEWATDEHLSLCFIHADRELIRRAVANLIQNSIRHNEDGCVIRVRVAAEPDACLICIEDNGTGISDEELTRLNAAPCDMSGSSDTSPWQHGLGLLIVKQIAASHGGTVHIGRSPLGGFLTEIRLPA